MSLQENITTRVDLYTGWLRECPQATNVSIEPTNDSGPYPYQWKIGSADSTRFLGYVIFDGPKINGSDAEKKAHLRSLLREVIMRVDDKN